MEADEIPEFGANSSAKVLRHGLVPQAEEAPMQVAAVKPRRGWLEADRLPKCTSTATAREEMQYGADLKMKPLMTLADIERLAQDRPDLFYTRSGAFIAPTRQESARDAIRRRTHSDGAEPRGVTSDLPVVG